MADFGPRLGLCPDFQAAAPGTPDPRLSVRSSPAEPAGHEGFDSLPKPVLTSEEEGTVDGLFPEGGNSSRRLPRALGHHTAQPLLSGGDPALLRAGLGALAGSLTLLT